MLNAGGVAVAVTIPAPWPASRAKLKAISQAEKRRSAEPENAILRANVAITQTGEKKPSMSDAGQIAHAKKRRRRRRPHRHGARRSLPTLAVIDLGTNNCRLLVARLGGDGSLRVVDSFSRIVRLGEGVAQTGALSADAIDRTIDALKICAERIRRRGATRVRAIATEACRRARNADVLVARARTEAGIELSIVSPDEEARLAAIGCAPLIGRNFAGALVFDIGGGSTEVIWLKANGKGVETVHSSSVPVGVVSLAEERGIGAGRGEYEKMRAEMIVRFAPIRDAMAEKGAFGAEAHHLLGTSGTVTTLAGIALGLERYSRARVDASWHESEAILGVVERLVALDVPERARIGCVGEERADLIVPGCAIFGAIHAHWPCTKLRVADRGLREGMLRELAVGDAS
jgi:exopolyphosphatase/guanosine-5'-triphosphate,3'-diphosphate pyrophosphatase